MKLLAISNRFVRTEHYEECFANYPEYELKTVFFGTEDRFEMRDIFHRIERNGPDAYPVPGEIYAEIEDADVLMVHVCPVPASLIERGKKLRAILTNRGGDTINAYSDSSAMVMTDYYYRYLKGKKPRFFVNPEVGLGR